MNTAIFGLVVVFVLVLLMGGLIAIGRKPRWEAVTVASGTAWYIYTALATGATLLLSGVALLIQVIIGFINPAVAGYSVQSFSFSSDASNAPNPASMVNTTLREQDLIWAILFILIGAAILFVHWRAHRGLDPVFGGSPEWRAWGTPLLATLFYGVVGYGAAIATIYGMLDTWLIDHAQAPDVWAPTLGIALVFLPAWYLVFAELCKQAKSKTTAPRPAILYTSAVPLTQPSAPTEPSI